MLVVLLVVVTTRSSTPITKLQLELALSPSGRYLAATSSYYYLVEFILCIQSLRSMIYLLLVLLVVKPWRIGAGDLPAM